MAWTKINRGGVVDLPGEYFFETGDAMPTTNIVEFSKATEVDNGREYVFFESAWHLRNPLIALDPSANSVTAESSMHDSGVLSGLAQELPALLDLFLELL